MIKYYQLIILYVLSFYTCCRYTFCPCIPFVVIRSVTLYLLSLYVMSLYTFCRYMFCLFIPFVVIRFVPLYLLSLYVLSLYVLSHYTFCQYMFCRYTFCRYTFCHYTFCRYTFRHRTGESYPNQTTMILDAMLCSFTDVNRHPKTVKDFIKGAVSLDC
jgi:hypothetical protein